MITQFDLDRSVNSVCEVLQTAGFRTWIALSKRSDSVYVKGKRGSRTVSVRVSDHPTNRLTNTINDISIHPGGYDLSDLTHFIRHGNLRRRLTQAECDG